MEDITDATGLPPRESLKDWVLKNLVEPQTLLAGIETLTVEIDPSKPYPHFGRIIEFRVEQA